MKTWQRGRTRLCVEELESRTVFWSLAGSQTAIVPALFDSAAQVSHSAPAILNDVAEPVDAFANAAISLGDSQVVAASKNPIDDAATDFEFFPSLGAALTADLMAAFWSNVDEDSRKQQQPSWLFSAPPPSFGEYFPAPDGLETEDR